MYNNHDVKSDLNAPLIAEDVFGIIMEVLVLF